MADASSQGGQSSPPRGWNALVHHITTHKIEFGLWLTRMATVFFTLAYYLPLFGNPYQSYYKALMANAATSALRLHQRMPRIQMTREFLAQIMLEDSAHYLFFSIIFLYGQPITVGLLPVVLFALLHAASYSLTLLDALGQNSWWGARMLISLVELQSRNILRMAAFTEIFLMPLVVILIFTGRANIITPFLYFRFLGLRYSSRRNPYSRTMFHELRLAVDEFAPRLPEAVRNMVYKAVNFISNLAPVTNYQQWAF